MVWIGFRSWKYAVVAMIPNIVPIYMVMGLLGWLGLKINMGAAMIAAVSFGAVEVAGRMSLTRTVKVVNKGDTPVDYTASYQRVTRRPGTQTTPSKIRRRAARGPRFIFSPASGHFSSSLNSTP